jgi:MFS transporter, AAHS family, 4-hydroxybenzoate transporter
MAAKGRAKIWPTDHTEARIAAVRRNANDEAALSQIEVSDWINQQNISRLQVMVLCLCGACALLEGLDAQIIGFLAPAIIHEWGLVRQNFTPVFMSGLVGLLIGCLLIAPQADQVGRKTVLICSVIAFAFCSFLSASAESLLSLSAFRFLTGVGIGGGMANAITLTSEYFPEHRRAGMTVIMFVGFSFGASLGGFLSAYLMPQFGWQSVFIAGGLLPLVLVVLLVFELPESVRYLVVHRAQTKDVIEILQRINPRSTFTRGTVFTIAEEQKTDLTVRHLFKEGRAFGTLLIWTIFFGSLLDIYLLASWLPVVLHDAGLSVSMSAVVTSMLHFGGVFVCIAITPILARRSCLAIMLPSYILAAIGIAALGSVGTGAMLLMVTTLVAGIGVVCGQNTANAFAAAYYPTYIRATGVGWALGIGRIGAVVGPGVGGLMLAFQWSRQTLLLATAVPELIAVGAILLLMRLERAKAAPYQQEHIAAVAS